MSRLTKEVWARLNSNTYTARYSEYKGVLEDYTVKAQDIVQRILTKNLSHGIPKKMVTTKVQHSPRHNMEEYEAKVIILSLKEAQDIMDTISQLEMEAKFNGNRDGRESISSELYRKLTQPTTQDPDPN